MLDRTKYEVIRKKKQYAYGRTITIKYFIVKCPNCGKIREVDSGGMTIRKTELCRTCSTNDRDRYRDGAKNALYKRGFTIDRQGYKVKTLPETHPYRTMCGKNNTRVYEHRLVMAEHLGRLLEPTEVVHHINGDKRDNRAENLELLSGIKAHLPSMAQQRYIQELKEEITQLKKEISQLRSENCMWKPLVRTG
jgi:hypothetical protein